MSSSPPDAPAGALPPPARGPSSPARCTLRPRHRTTAAATLLLAALVLAPAVPATARPTDAGPAARLVVEGLQAVVGPATDDTVPEGEEVTRLPSTLTARVLVQNLGDEPLDGLRLVLTVHDRARTRSELRAALDGGDMGPVEQLALDRELDPLPAGGFAQLEVSLDAMAAELVHDDEDVVIHPLSLSVARGVDVLDEVRTAAVGVSREVGRPLETVLLAPLDGPVATQPAMLLPGGRLDRVLRALEGTTGEDVTIAPAPHAIEDLAALVDEAVPGAADMLARVRAVATEGTAAAVSTPYALADVPALAASATTEELATAAIVAGRQRLPTLLETTPAAAHLLVSPPSPESIDLAPADVLLTLWDDTAGPDLAVNPSADIPPALRTGRGPSGREVTLLVGDPWMTEHLATATGLHGWDVDAHRVVVESAMLFAQAPGRAGRPLAVLPPIGWEAPGRLPDELYTRLAAAPWLRPADPVTVAARAEVRGAWGGAMPVAPARTVLLGRIAELRERLDGLTAAVADSEVPPDVIDRSDDLLRAVSVWPVDDPLDRAEVLLDDLQRELDAAIGEVVVPQDSVVTLASERGVIPVTVQHPEGVPLDVLVEVAAQGRLSFPEGTTRPLRLEEGGTATVSFAATALGRGTFPMAVTVRTPTGDVVLARALVSVRTSAVSRPALLAVGGTILALLVLGRLRRPRRGTPHLEVVE